MDSNLIDLKKDVNDKVSGSGDDEAKVMLQSSGRLPIGEENLSAESHQDDNAHTEDYFSNDRKLAGPNDFDFEHIDPQAFMQRMSASAKEAQEQLDAKFAAESNDFNEFLGGATQDVGDDLQYGSQSMTNMTRNFMNAERGLLGGGDKPQPKAVDDIAAPDVEKPAEVPEDDLLGGNGDGHYQPSAPPSAENADAFRASNNFYDDMSDEDGVVTTSVLQKPSMADIVSTSTKDSDTDSASASYNPSPAKKRPVADTIKEQDNEKFISSEDLLSDYRDDRSGTPEFLSANSGSVGKIKTTDLDADDELLMPSAEANEQRNSKPTAKAAPVSAAARAAAYKNKYFRNKPGLISVEEVFYKYGLVESLIYWRDVKKSGVVFGVGLVTLMAVSCFSVISVFAYLSLLALGGTISFKIYKSVMQAVQKTSNGHPFKEYLDMDLTLSQEKIQNFAGVAVAHVNGFTAELRRLFLVEDLIDSIKFGVILWVMTYIGAWFNGMTLVILAFVSLFTLPKVYENNKQSIDAYLDLVRSKLTEITEKIKAAIPIGAKKPIGIETDKNK